MREPIVNINTFTNIPLIFFKTLGIQPFQELDSNHRPLKNHALTSTFLWMICFVCYVNLLLLVFGEMTYFFLGLGEFANFVELTEVMMCIGFVWLSIAKVSIVLWQRRKTNRLIVELDHIFPVTQAEQAEYKANEYSKHTVRIMTLYTWLQMVMIWIFNLSPLIDTLIGFIRAGTWEMRFPYIIWYPFDPFARGWFELNYFSQLWAGYASSAGMIATDLLLCGLALEVCMHFDQLSRTLLSLRPISGRLGRDYNGVSTQDNAKFKMRECITRHNQIVRLSVLVDEIFGVSILFNFVSSVIIICVLGFLVATSDDSTHMTKFMCTLLTCITQIYMVCYLGDKFMESSVGVANAAWQSEWFDADLQYKKDLIMVLIRGHRVQYLRGYKFSVASMGTFSNLLSTSWQFFAILHSLYEK